MGEFVSLVIQFAVFWGIPLYVIARALTAGSGYNGNPWDRD